MEGAPLLGRVPGPEDETVPDLLGAESGFVSERLPRKASAAEEEDSRAFRDPHLSPAEPPEPLPRAGREGRRPAEPPAREHEEEALGAFPGLAELEPPEHAGPPAAPGPQAYSVRFLSPLLPLGAWARDGAARPGLRVIPVEMKEGGGLMTSENLEEAALQRPLSQEPSQFPSSQEPEDASGGSYQDTNPMVLCQLRGGAPVLCMDSPGTGALKALHWVPQGQDQKSPAQSDAPRPVAALVGRLLPVPAKLSLVTQQLDDRASPSPVNGSAFPEGPALAGPSKIAVAGYCNCFANGDFCNNCRYNNCCNSLCHGIEQFKAIKACLDRNLEDFQPKIGAGQVGDPKPRHGTGFCCRLPSCRRSNCECFEAKATCSSVCKCAGCRDLEESPEQKLHVAAPTYVETGGVEGKLAKSRRERRSSCISWEVVEATCACLLAQGEVAERERCPESLAQRMILEEFGRCLSQILQTEFRSTGLTVE